MNRHVNSIAGRLSLRPPQRRSLKILDRITEIAPLGKEAEINAVLEIIRSEFPSVTDFEREFPSLCFALATGVGKTRLMGAFISFLHLAHGINNFFVLAPNLTIYNKLIADFTPNTPKYVFKGIAEFATNAPAIITGDNYDQRDPASSSLFGGVRVNIFNISKINSEVRGGKSPRIKRLSEYIGESYFDYLAGLPDLVMLMDESHRYRASAGIRAINELKPILGLELTATPFVESARGAVAFKNVIYDYPLGRAMADGFVKEPAVVTRKDFNPAGMTTEEIERLKLEDGVRLHESVKVELETYARESGNAIVKPFLLVIARDTSHAGQLLSWIQSDGFFEGRYNDKVIQVDSSQTGAKEDEMVERLLKVELTSEPTEIVIHVNMLKEGWDVTNLYTIMPLRAANARILIEQSIGRGLRLPYGKRTGVTAVDRLNIVVKAVEEQRAPGQMELEGVTEKPDIAAMVAKTVELVIQQTIDIPRILVVPRGEVQSGFRPFTLNLDALKYPAVSDELWIQALRTNEREVLALGRGGIKEARLEDYVVGGLVDFDDISYDEHADLLYDLATQTVRHFQSYLNDEDTRKVLRCYQRDIARFIHVQMQEHYWEEAAGYEVKVSKGFTELKQSAYTYSVQEPPTDYRVAPADKSNMAKYLFGNFQRCLYPVQKFDSDTERKLAVILERDTIRWFKPAKGQFQIYYKTIADHLEYQPDFVAETADTIYMLEPKMRKELDDPIVIAKKEVATKWCANASDHASTYGGKPWRYLLIPHNEIAENITLTGLAGRFG